MHIIEPCCAARHMMQLRDVLGKDGEKQFEGYGDLSLTELLPAILTRYGDTELLIAAPSVPDQAAEIIAKWMRKQWARNDGNGKIDVVRHLTVVTDTDESPAVGEWLRDGAFAGRLTVVARQQAETAILLPDFAVTGPVNMRYGRHFVATATTKAGKVRGLWQRLLPKEDAPENPEKPADGLSQVQPADTRARRSAAVRRPQKGQQADAAAED